jgi:hypothetical protein
VTGPLLPSDPTALARVSQIITDAFDLASAQLDSFAEENALMSDEIMGLVNRTNAGFAAHYARHIRDGWDWENAIEVEA